MLLHYITNKQYVYSIHWCVSMLTIAASSVLRIVIFTISVFMLFYVVVPGIVASRTENFYQKLLHNFCNCNSFL